MKFRPIHSRNAGSFPAISVEQLSKKRPPKSSYKKILCYPPALATEIIGDGAADINRAMVAFAHLIKHAGDNDPKLLDQIYQAYEAAMDLGW